MNIGRISTPILLSFLIIMFMTVIGCDKKPATSVISGTVSGDVIQGVTINLTGAATTSTTTDSSGNFSFTNQENGNYTVTPYLDGYTFSPTSKDVAVSGASVTGINFTSTHSGYGISGTVTGDVAANVTLTLLNVPNSTTTTTDSDGKYTLRSTDIGNSTYIVKPYLAGYKFNPYTQSVPMDNASVTGIDFVSSSAYTTAGSATGTYTWDPSTPTGGELTITWTSKTAPCNWPQAATDAESSVTITNTTMTWPNTITWSDGIAWLGMMIWTRTSATANDPAGVWTAYDQSGNKYTATFTATDATSGSISLVENIVACAYTWSEVISSGLYQISLSYQDPQHEATSVSVTGPGISGSQTLKYNAGEWNINGTVPGGVIDISSLIEKPPYTYTFTVTEPETVSGITTTWTWDEKSCFVDWPTFPIHFYNWDALTMTLTFSWTGVTDASGYVVQVKDSSYNLIWESLETSSNSINYGGAAVLTSGDTYYFYVQVRGTSYCANGTSYAEASFIAP